MPRRMNEAAPEPGPLIRRFFAVLARLAGQRPEPPTAPETKARITRLDARSRPPRKPRA
jgi:hypothetical protein